MYTINDKSAAIRRLQIYLGKVSSETAVVPSGVYDDNTRLAVINFQRRLSKAPTGVVDRETLDLIYAEYISVINKQALTKSVGSFISFPLREGDMTPAIIHLNRTLGELLDYYGIVHRIRSSGFYSSETAEAVRAMRKIYLLPEYDYIDEELYIRMVADHNSIGG